MRVCVIGAGAAGLCAIKYALSFGCEVTAFEQNEKIGGTWRYTDEVGKDKYGNDIHSSMYKSLNTNLPKELMSFPDFPFPLSDKSFIPASDVDDYLNLYADNFQLRSHIRFEHHVLRVRPLQETGDAWEIIVQNLAERSYEQHYCDIVLVCNGHFSTPSTPPFHGSEVFRGGQIHSHDYKLPDPFAGKRVLVIGGGPSGVDITQDVAKCAETVFWSNHLSPPKVIKAENVVQKGDVERLTELGATFKNGTCESFDEIIYCTGYKYTFPFLSVDCGILCDDNYVRPLYKHVISIISPTMGLIGLPLYVSPFPSFDLQIRFCLTFMTGRMKLPSKDEMALDTEHDMKLRKERGVPRKKAHMMGSGIQDEYFASLAKLANISPLSPVLFKMYDENRNRMSESQSYRSFIYRVTDEENFTSTLMP